MNFKRGTMCLMFAIVFLAGVMSCGHFPADIHPNPSLSGYHRMEFDISYTGVPIKEIGIGNIYLNEDQDLGNISFKFYGIYKGILYMKSDACGINVAVPFDGAKVFYLKDLISHPLKCSISLTAETASIDKKQHNLVETGEIKINVIPHGEKPVSFEYVRTNAIKSNYKTYSYIGQGSIQRQEGDLTLGEEFTVKAGLEQGGIFRVTGCNASQTFEGSFEKGDIVIKLKDIYKKSFLSRIDTCDLEVVVIPNEIPEGMIGRFSVNIFDKDAVPLENLSWEIKKDLGSKKIYASGQDYVLACSINDQISLKNNCSLSYKKDTVYWIKAITAKGRKSVFAVKNDEVLWTE